MTCVNCGAEIEKKDALCPYCGAMNYEGAEKAYQDKLGGIKEDLNQLQGTPEKVYHRKAVSFFKIALIVTVVTFIVVCMVILVGTLWDNKKTQDFDNSTHQLLLWEEELFPKLDAWYEQGEYENIYNYKQQLYAEQNEFIFGSWEHNEFMNYYSDYFTVTYVKKEFSHNARISTYWIEEAIASTIELVYYLDDQRLDELCELKTLTQTFGITEEEKKLIQGYRQEAEKLLYGELGFTKKEAETLFQSCIREDFMAKSPCYDYADVIEKRLYDNKK